MLEFITEKVSGMSYTDYIKENIAGKINADHTRTAWALFNGNLGDARAALYKGALQVEFPYEMAAGPGGIYATAPDVADFGAAFFTGNEALLSENAKTQMLTRQSDDPKDEGYGLGWDFVEQVRYEKENIKVCGKGGDMPYMHSFLLVAPDEQISTAVLTAGNDISEHTYSDGTSGISLDLSDGTRCRSVESLPLFTGGINEINLVTGEAQWYCIGEEMGKKSISIERPEKSSIYVFNKFRELVYSTHIKGSANTIDLPQDGYIVFIGETGNSVKVFG